MLHVKNEIGINVSCIWCTKQTTSGKILIGLTPFTSLQGSVISLLCQADDPSPCILSLLSLITSSKWKIFVYHRLLYFSLEERKSSRYKYVERHARKRIYNSEKSSVCKWIVFQTKIFRSSIDEEDEDVAGECVDEDIIVLLWWVISDLVERRMTSSWGWRSPLRIDPNAGCISLHFFPLIFKRRWSR